MTRAAPALVWFRRDLRLADNPALHAALASGGPVVPLFVLPDPPQGDFGGAALWWLHGSLQALATALGKAGNVLVLRRGDPALIVPRLAAELGAATVHAGHCAEPGWRTADAAVGAALARQGGQLVLHQSVTLFDPETVRTRVGGIYGMYTPFANAVRAMPPPAPPLPAPNRIPRTPRNPASDALDSWNLLPRHPDWAAGLRATWSPGATTAERRMAAFLKGAVSGYGAGRNLPGQDLTSALSPHLRFGEVSPRTVWAVLHAAAPAADHRIFAGELIWRDFAFYLLWHHPELPKRPLREAFARLPWRQDRAGLRAWQRGRTGIPIVDAGMRQLWQIGWMHNRVRMITASFLVKHLLIDWRAGADWFMDTLVDADLAANSMNWQWVAGTGIDSQPFFRVFNPVSQGQKFDADGAYVRRFVPELARLPDSHLHAPWHAPEDVLREAGLVLGKTYPTPIVDLAAARVRALQTWKATVRTAD